VDAIAIRIYRCPVTTHPNHPATAPRCLDGKPPRLSHSRGRFEPEGASGVHAGVMLVERR
jgi:hypothetical protein